jgi:hypothetical protein
MTPVFQVNFRREAYQRDMARVRRRVMVLGLWVAYFGAIVVVLGLYGLNCAVVTRRAGQVERQAQRLRQVQGPATGRRLSADDLQTIGRYLENPRRWRDRLARLTQLLPPGARLTSVAQDPQGTGGAGGGMLVITGVLRVSPGEDRMRGVMALESALRGDTTFAAGYANVRLASTRILGGGDPATEFTIECR